MFPHEAKQLLRLSHFEDTEKQAILQLIAENSVKTSDYKEFDTSIDKRKYSYVKTWCQTKLETIDIDRIYDQLCRWEYEVMTDSISLEGEKELIKLFKTADTGFFNFLKLYDLGRIFRHYLQIRLRTKDFQTVDIFLTKNRTSYEYARLVNDKLHHATEDIISQYLDKTGDTTTWEQWLEKVYHDDSLDGYNRLLAWIRLIFIGHNYRKFYLLKDQFDYFETMFDNGKFYSRRILANFYSQYLLYYASILDFEKAAYYGYLSVKEKNNDFLYYVNNLAAILLRKKEPEKAFELLRSAAEQANAAQNFHNKIGHASYLILAYTDTLKLRQAETHADVFFSAYKSEIFEYRWHLFFSAYLKVILYRDNFRKLIKIYKQYSLGDKDVKYQISPNYTPTIPWMYHIAQYKENQITRPQLVIKLSDAVTSLLHRKNQNMRHAIINLTDISKKCVPEVWGELEHRFNE